MIQQIHPTWAYHDTDIPLIINSFIMEFMGIEMRNIYNMIIDPNKHGEGAYRIGD